MPVEPELSEVIREAISSRLLDVHTALPAVVESYDAAAQTCTAQPVVSRTVFDDAGEPQQERLPSIQNVPVKWQRGGGFFATMPLGPGDHVLLVFCESAIGQWRQTGEVSEPGDLRRHGLSYPYALPGGAPNADPIADASATDAVMGKDGSNAQVIITAGGDICIGKGAVEKLARADRTNSELIDIATALSTHTHPAGALLDSMSSPVTGSTAPPLSPPYTAGMVDADIVKGL